VKEDVHANLDKYVANSVNTLLDTALMFVAIGRWRKLVTIQELGERNVLVSVRVDANIRVLTRLLAAIPTRKKRAMMIT
jgi:hypothetical protein